MKKIDLNSIPQVLKEVLKDNGIDSEKKINDFFDNSINKLQSIDVFKNFDKISERLKKAKENNENILIYGDFDADGITSTVILSLTLKKLGIKSSYYIPDRFNEGYGPNLKKYKEISENNVDLLITVDNGISGVEEIEFLKENDIDVIILDHHHIPEKIPNTPYIAHPNIVSTDNDESMVSSLSGAGIVFELSRYLLNSVDEELMNFAAIGTISDVVSLKNENRIIVHNGLKSLYKTNNKGLKKIIKNTFNNKKDIKSEDISFFLTPKINSVGRLGNANIVTELFLSEDEGRIIQIIDEINNFNNDRKLLVDNWTSEILNNDDSIFYENNNFLIINNNDINIGILGLLANKLSNERGKVSIVISEENNSLRGSIRNPFNSFDVSDTLGKFEDVFSSFGGHSKAAGFSINEKKLENFKKNISSIKIENNTEIIEKDYEISENELDDNFFNNLKLFEPFGEGNKQPYFNLKNQKIIDKKLVGNKKNHLRVNLFPSNIDAMFFFFDNVMNMDEGINYDVKGNISREIWNNNLKINFFAKEISPAPFFSSEYIKKIFKNDYKNIYRYIKSNNNLKWSSNITNKVFLELGFIEKKGNNIVLNNNSSKKDLSQSKIFNSYFKNEYK